MSPSAVGAVTPVLISPFVEGACVALAGCGGGGVGATGVCIIPANAGQLRANINAAVVRVFRIVRSHCYEVVEWLNRPSRDDVTVF